MKKLAIFAAGFVAAFVVVFVCGWTYLQWGQPPVATADAAFPLEKRIVKVPLRARIAREMEKQPFAGSEEVYVSGAMVYKENCAQCHGVPGQDVDYAKWMFPVAPQLFKKHAKGNVVGVSDDEPGETYWKVANGIRLTGMPAFNHVLTDIQMWQVTLLLKNADQQLPDPVMSILTKP